MIFIARIKEDTDLYKVLIEAKVAEFSFDDNIFELTDSTYTCRQVKNLISLLKNENIVEVVCYGTSIASNT